MILMVVLMAWCASCTTRPKVTLIDPVTGVKTTYDLGGTFAAKAKGVVASIEVPKGPKLKYSSIEEDSTEVPEQLIVVGGAVAGGIIANKGEAIRETNATARHTTTTNAGVTKHLSDNKLKKATFVPPPVVE